MNNADLKKKREILFSKFPPGQVPEAADDLQHLDEIEVEHNIGAPEKRLKRSEQEAYVKAWEQRPHGDHDDTPPEWRDYK